MLVGFALVTLVVAVTGGRLADVLTGWLYGALGTPYAAAQTAAYAVPLVVVALGVTPALRAGVIAVGAEGQMQLGAITATVTALSPLGQLPTVLALPIGALAGMLGGAAWSMIPAVPLLRWQASEILTALMANFVAVQLLAYLLRTSLSDPGGYSVPRSADLPDTARIPFLPVSGRLTAAALLVLVLVAVGLWWYHSRSARLLDIFAENKWLAARLGLSRARAILATTAVSGAAAGLAGWMQVAGPDGRLTPGVAGGIAFNGLVVAVLGGNRPVRIVAAGLIMAALVTGADGVQLLSGTPSSIGVVSQGILLLAVALALALTQRRVRLGRPSD
ncbi:ABC transporter permease [Amycolatopsis sp. OK19-0408]|uniref:ABC transporter permease n=1 Tax=Amycolatopsis iheyensis TaxID=2945988 RepID=A0A9X2SPK6_9PSEU|nr:ABC transporter permease [Amycolatopsis iheyensis]MCR6488261.1 ABC transporter permease [Amycolatopsis iheyensis]